MVDKINNQINLMKKIKAVKLKDILSKIINNHLLKHMEKNFYNFFKQQFRCKSCNKKYRRVTLSGKCYECGGELTQTVNIKSATSYIGIIDKIISENKINTKIEIKYKNYKDKLKIMRIIE
jgi:DNA polymerase II large subunit